MVHLIELQKIAETQTGYPFTTVELVEDLRHPVDGQQLLGVMGWRPDEVGIAQPIIKLDPDHGNHSSLHTLLHEVRHVQLGRADDALPRRKVREIRADLVQQFGKENMDRINRAVATVTDHLVDKHEMVEDECDRWASAAIVKARVEGGDTLGGAVRWLSENKFEEESIDE